MRNVTETICRAFLNGKAMKISNSETDGQNLFLHGNKIAKIEDGKLFINFCGWATPTTRERLNGLLALGGYKSYVSIKDIKNDSKAILNGEIIDKYAWHEIVK